MRPRRITAEQLAKAYEMVCSGSTYQKAGKAIRAERSYLNILIKKCEREGLGWIR